MQSRRDFLKGVGHAWAALSSGPLFGALLDTGTGGGPSSTRCINVVNFIRGVEPRMKTDLLLPVQKQMELIVQHRLPATWLLQFDALVSGPFVGFLKAQMTKGHEVGFWFEMNEMLCRAAEVEWRGRPGYEWDHLPPVAFTIGYTPEERVKLADAAMKRFKEIWGQYPSSVASWNLDSLTMAHLVERYGVEAFAVCRDQIATDGFTIWGAPIAGYYPSKVNCWSPALSKANQTDAPVFRMLGQDPVYYYYRQFRLPNGRVVGEPDTMEPTWTSGRSPRFIKEFLGMISENPCLRFAYAQLGQENNFSWDTTAEGYPLQMAAIAALRDTGAVHVETMGESGRRFKRAFTATPPQAQVMLSDPMGNTNPAERSIWYQSRFYRANLHFRGDLPFLRDLTVYSDRNPQPFLKKATRQNDVEQRMPAVLDGYHWSRSPGSLGRPGAGGFFSIDENRLRLTGEPQVRESGNALLVELPTQRGVLRLEFDERDVSISHTTGGVLALSFEWDRSKAALTSVQPRRVTYRWQDFDYVVDVRRGVAKAPSRGWAVTEDRGEISLRLAQPA